MGKVFDVVVIGAGAAGLVVAIGTAKGGKRGLLIEKELYGGDCTNFGCIPSKALIASARAAHTLRHAADFGIEGVPLSFEGKGALKRVQRIVEEVRSHEEPSELETLEVETLKGVAHFVDKRTLAVDGKEVCGRQIVIATGSYPALPSIEGMENTPFLTNETIFNIDHIPKRLICIGGGPISCEIAQSFSRLGSKVTLIESHSTILPCVDRSAQEILKNTFRKEGISLVLGSPAKRVHYDSHFTVEVGEQSIEGDALLVGVGRRPDLEKLKLDAAGIRYAPQGIPTDPYGRTNIKHIWAVGDVIGPPFFTHFAETQARSVLTNLLIPAIFKKSRQPLPSCIYTDPEVASIGLREEECNPKKIAIYSIPFSEVDRAITEGCTEGHVKIITKKWSSKILGATIVGPRAGEVLMEISTAMHAKLPLRKLSTLIHPYPTFSLAIRKAADKWLTETLLKVFR